MSGTTKPRPGKCQLSGTMRRHNSKYILVIIILASLVSLTQAELIDELLPIIKAAESSGRSWAVSRDGGYGLYQVTAPVLADYNRNHKINYMMEDMLSPKMSEEVVRWYLGWLNNYLAKYGYSDDKLRIVLAYNWGIGNLRRNDFRVPSWFIGHRNLVYRAFCQAEIKKQWAKIRGE